MKMKKIAAALAAIVAGVASFASAETMYDWTASGTYKLGKTVSYTMPEDGEMYLKLSGIKAGSSYTFIASGNGASVDVVYTYADDGDIWDEDLATSEPDVKTENRERCFIDSEVWTDAYIVRSSDMEDEEWKEMKVSPKGYFLHVKGEDGESISVTSSSGIVEEDIPTGDIDNPKVLTASLTPATYTASYVEGTYNFLMKMTAGCTYLLCTTGGTADEPINLGAVKDSQYVIQDVSSQVAEDGNMALLVTANASVTLEFAVSGEGEKFGLTYQYGKQGGICALTVNTKGAAGTWTLKGVSTKHASGETVAVLGSQTVVFGAVTGFSTPTNMVVTVDEGISEKTVTGIYMDKYDPKDDTVAGATKITPSAKRQTAARTLFAEDAADHFVFTAKAGTFYSFALEDLEGEAVMTLFAKGTPGTILAGPATSLAKLSLDKGDYIIKVAHAKAESAEDAQYTLAFTSANVGTIAFAKTAVSAKKSAGSVTLSVTRSSSEGKVRVLYGTVNGAAQPGVDYVAQQGELVWENGDKAAKTITIKTIPEALATEAISRAFTVQLKAVEEDELEDDEYAAAFTAGKDTATVTLTEAKGKTPTAVKAATVKTETVPLETGTYQGVIVEDGSALTNGFPALASVTFTAKDATKSALSAKVILGGKTYSFTGNTWDADETTDETAVAILTYKQTISKVVYTNTLRIAVARGATATTGDWKNASAQVELVMNVPDANGKGVQEDIFYTGELYRNNAKIQDYLYAVTNVVGYYTIALVPTGVMPEDGIPSGNGYLTLTISNKGVAKIAGKLADGTTSPSCSSIVAVLDEGETILVPVFAAKSPYCFGGTLKLVRGEDGVFAVDASEPLLWNNDNALLSYDGESGWNIPLDPAGGYFNTVDNLQAHYLTCAFEIETAEPSDLLAEALTSGYSYVTEISPNDAAITLTGNTLATDKRVLVKSGKLYDLAASVNPCNVQVKLTRATGLVTGSFSAWTENEDGSAQKELSNLKHYGILLLTRGVADSLDNEVLTAGFFNQAATLTYLNEKGQKKTRKFTASLPFNVRAVDQGEPDWYEDDWGERPEEE